MNKDKLWSTIVTVLATLCVAFLMQFLIFGSTVPTRAEVTAAVAEAKAEAKTRADAINEKLDEMAKDLQAISLRTEHIDTLIEAAGRPEKQKND